MRNVKQNANQRQDHLVRDTPAHEEEIGQEFLMGWIVHVLVDLLGK